MHGYSASLQRKLDQRRYCDKVPLTGLDALGVAGPHGMPTLQPVKALAFADNLQMTMYRDSLFMRKAATDMFQEGELNLQLGSWELFQFNVR